MYDYFYSYQSETAFSQPVFRHSYLLRCLPMESGSQSIKQMDLDIFGDGIVQCGTDCFGAQLRYGYIPDFHSAFGYKSSGLVSCDKYYGMPFLSDDYIFTVPSKLCRPSLDMRIIADDTVAGVHGSELDKALRLCDFVSHYMIFQSNSTHNSTTAGEAFAQRKGVCQDFAQILIAMCRCCGIPARYVNGLVVGEGATHAWVEVLSNNIWFGVDPTANILISKGYIKISHGRDSSDCPVNRGLFCGLASQQTSISVFVQEL